MQELWPALELSRCARLARFVLRTTCKQNQRRTRHQQRPSPQQIIFFEALHRSCSLYDVDQSETCAIPRFTPFAGRYRPDTLLSSIGAIS